MPETIPNYQGEGFAQGINQAEGKELDYSYFLEEAQKLAGELEELDVKAKKIIEDGIIPAAEDAAHQTIKEIDEAVQDCKAILAGKQIDPRRKRRLEQYIERAEKMVDESPQLEEINKMKKTQIELLQGIKHLILLDKKFDLILQNKKKFVDENV
jgi:hypothetical protein